MKKYLLDTNIFIQSHKMHYHPSFCQSFWTWLSRAHSSNCFFSIDKVKNELVRGSSATDTDELSLFVRNAGFPDSFFIPSITDVKVVSKYRAIIQWANSHTQYNHVAKADFASFDKADAALIATAMAHDYIVVTAETSAPNSVKSIKIPDAAKAHDVKTITLTELLRNHAISDFIFRHD